jgi:hypothetical protein
MVQTLVPATFLLTVLSVLLRLKPQSQDNNERS